MNTPRPMGTREDVAQYIGVTTKTLDEWRRAGTGPPAYRPGGRFVRYFWDEVIDWVKAQPDDPAEPTGEYPADRFSRELDGWEARMADRLSGRSAEFDVA